MALSLVSDAGFSIHNLGSAAPGYVAIFVHGLSSVVLDHSYGVLSPALGVDTTVAASTLGASAFALPFYLFRSFMLGFPSEPVLPLLSLASIPFISYSVLFLSPIALRSLKEVAPTSRHVVISYPMSVCLAAGFGPLAFSHMPSWTDIAVATVLYSGEGSFPLCFDTMLSTQPLGMYPTSQEAFVASPRTPTSRLLRGYLKTILSNAESRRIFYFLMLNMAYMLVQMLYGVWTNSLGLISDAIHMAFDCMAIGVGLFASVMATWDPNERFTYGYGRIETLSGFANGIFLILISIFIVFEAIQRILDPPEMDTSQLLLVSSLGLAVNLFGMFAMGGHHHHVWEDTRTLMDIHMDIPRKKSRSLVITPIHILQLPHMYLHNMRGVFLHVMADTLGSVGVIISTLLIQFYGWTGFDPIASLFIAILIVASVIPLVLDTGKVLALDIGDRASNVNHTLGEVEAIEGVVAYSDPHFWPKDAEKLIGSIKVQIESPALAQQQGKDLSLDHVVEHVDTLLRKKIHGLEELTIQVEEAQ
ncbi:putative zinc transporter msc2 [Marasmius tenuissimus]|uniref:Zinc transporter msc2 n=1 Tax=Marasmius tenuissimus TaxID=585030 RepID=A0ABR2ZHQ7_9AGAR